MLLNHLRRSMTENGNFGSSCSGLSFLSSGGWTMKWEDSKRLETDPCFPSVFPVPSIGSSRARLTVRIFPEVRNRKETEFLLLEGLRQCRPYMSNTFNEPFATTGLKLLNLMSRFHNIFAFVRASWGEVSLRLNLRVQKPISSFSWWCGNQQMRWEAVSNS